MISLRIMLKIQNHSLVQKVFDAGMDGGYVDVVYGDKDQEILVPEDIRAELDEQIKNLKDGKLKVDTAL